MSQISLIDSPTPDNRSQVGGEAKNPLPAKIKNDLKCSDVAGLSWIFLDDPLDFENYA